MHLSKRSVIRLFVILAIIVVVALLWIFKNNGEDAVIIGLSSTNSAIAAINDAIPAEPNADFSLLVTEAIDLDQLKSHGLPIMIDFGADSCVPCKEMAPVLIKLNAELQGKVIIRFVDVWKDQTLANGFPIRVIPTQFFFNADGSPYVPSDPESSGMTMYSLKDTEDHVLTAHEGGMTEEMILEALHAMGLAR